MKPPIWSACVGCKAPTLLSYPGEAPGIHTSWAAGEAGGTVGEEGILSRLIRSRSPCADKTWLLY